MKNLYKILYSSLKNYKILWSFFLGLVIFLISFYIFFPTRIVGSVLLYKINFFLAQQQIPIIVQTENTHILSGLGLEFDGVKASVYNSQHLVPLRFDRFQIRFSLLSLLIGRWEITLHIWQPPQSKGQTEGQMILHLYGPLSFAKNQIKIENVKIQMTRFCIDHLIPYFFLFVQPNQSFMWKMLKSYENQIPMLKGYLNASIEYKNSKLKSVYLTLNDGELSFVNSDLMLPDEPIQKAQLSLHWAKDSWLIDNSSQWRSPHLSLDIWGSIQKDNARPPKTQIDISTAWLLLGGFQESFGFWFPLVLGCDPERVKNGNVQFRLVGTTDHFQCK